MNCLAICHHDLGMVIVTPSLSLDAKFALYVLDTSSIFSVYVSIILLTDVNLWAKLYKQQNIDSLSGRDATSGFSVTEQYPRLHKGLHACGYVKNPHFYLSHADCMFTSQPTAVLLRYFRALIG